MRIDKYIWAIRLFKTRSIASKACQNEKVKLNNQFVKAAKALKTGDIISIKEIPIWRTFKVLDFPKSRIGAKLVENYVVETTSTLDKEMLKTVQAENRKNQLLGIKGRPTKKDRRDLDKNSFT